MNCLHHIVHLQQETGAKIMIKKYNHILFLLYIPIYMACFIALESRPVELGTNIHIALDDMIPFNKYFIIPYFLWFAYITVTIIFFFFYDKLELIKYAVFLITGMSICIIIYAVFPSYQTLRPVITDNDIFSKMVRFIYSIDSSSDVCPSIHVLNSIAAHIAIVKSRFFKSKRTVKAFSFILVVLICLSTVFLKQHSVVDGVCAIILAAILYIPVYSRFSIFNRFKKVR